MWTVIYLVKGDGVAARLRKMLEELGILVMLRQTTDEDDKSQAFYEILVPQAEVEQAQEVLICAG